MLLYCFPSAKLALDTGDDNEHSATPTVEAIRAKAMEKNADYRQIFLNGGPLGVMPCAK